MSESYYNKFFIDKFLSNSLFCCFSYSTVNLVHSHLLFFVHTDDGHFYLFSDRYIDLMRSIKVDQDVSLLIYREDDVVLDIVNMSINCKVDSIIDFSIYKKYDDLFEVFELFKYKSPRVYSAYKTKNMDGSVLFKISANGFNISSFRDLSLGKSPVVLSRELSE